MPRKTLDDAHQDLVALGSSENFIVWGKSTGKGPFKLTTVAKPTEVLSTHRTLKAAMDKVLELEKVSDGGEVVDMGSMDSAAEIS